MSTPAPSTVVPPELKLALSVLVNGENLSEAEAHGAMSRLITGDVPEPAIAALLTALKIKGETPEELAGAVRAVRERMTPFDPGQPVLDTCGTGGDGTNSVNVSTAVAIVVAASGVAVAKHGNRSASGNSGSAEVLTELGVAIEAPPETLRRCLDELGLTFLYAPKFHPALRHVGAVRRLLPFRTLFNLVGPLANPALPAFQLVGVAGDRQADLVAEALLRLGMERAAVVTGGDGLDEVSLDAPTHVRWIESGHLTFHTWTPDDFKLGTVSAADLRVSGPADSAARLLALFNGEHGPVRSIVLANAAAALKVAGRVKSLNDGVVLATSVLDTGAARRLLERWKVLSHEPA